MHFATLKIVFAKHNNKDIFHFYIVLQMRVQQMKSAKARFLFRVTQTMGAGGGIAQQ